MDKVIILAMLVRINLQSMELSAFLARLVQFVTEWQQVSSEKIISLVPKD
jgi:ABC-type bacteriocin/lantibiotic exporter with double-glycine peptidase domain